MDSSENNTEKGIKISAEISTDIRIDQFEIGTMRNFVYLLTSGSNSFVVDPQPILEPWVQKMKTLRSTLKGVLLTHTHYDHIGGIPNLLKEYDVPIYVNEADLFRLKKEYHSKVKPIQDNQKIKLGNSEILAMHTPGHSAGESCFYFENNQGTHLLTGDTVFVGLVGRTDLETGSDEELFKTLQRIKMLPADTLIYPGHNYGRTPTSTIARECKESDAFRCKNINELKAVP